MAHRSVKLLRARVGHKRLWPKQHSLLYRVFYVVVPITRTQPIRTPALLSFNRFNILSLYTKDHGAKQPDVEWYDFIAKQLKQAGQTLTADHSVTLICHPRLFGYAFNPISYWLINDANNQLVAVLCEVNNTFRGSYNYLLMNDHGDPITPEDVLRADKKLYVSPFNRVEGYYEFTFSSSESEFRSDITYFDDKRRVLDTFIGGNIRELSSWSVCSVVVLYPLMTVLVVVRIHWNALRLYLKGLKPTLKERKDSLKK